MKDYQASKVLSPKNKINQNKPHKNINNNVNLFLWGFYMKIKKEQLQKLIKEVFTDLTKEDVILVKKEIVKVPTKKIKNDKEIISSNDDSEYELNNDVVNKIMKLILSGESNAK